MFYICFIYLLINYKMKEYRYKYFVIMSFFYFIFSFLNSDVIQNFNIYKDKSSFMYVRNVSNKYFYRVGDVYDYINNLQSEYGDNIFIFSNNAYLIKLELGIVINRYDLILDGNMGYKGDIKRIGELNDICSSLNCLFIIDRDIAGIQINKNIRSYVIDNYNYVRDLDYYQVYTNKKE